MSKFHTSYHCKTCHHELNRHELMYSSGTCPYCGHTNTSTVVDYYKKAYKNVCINPDRKWYQFPKYKREYNEKDL